MTKAGSLFLIWIRILGYQGLGFAMTIAAALLVVAHVPPAVYGDYVLWLSIIQVVSGVGLSWVAQSTLLFAREEVLHTGDVRHTLTGALLLQTCLLVAFAVFGWLVRWLLHPLIEIPIDHYLLLVAAVGLTAAFETVSYALQGAERFDGLGRGVAVNKLGPLCALFAVWVGVQATPLLLLVGYVAGLVAALSATLVAMPQKNLVAGRSTSCVVGQLVGYGGRLPIASAAGVLSAWMHIWFVRVYAGTVEAGIYGWAAGIHLLFGAALIPLSAVIAPHLIDLALKNEREASRRRVELFQALTLLASIMAPVILGGIRLATSALPERYAAAGPILVLLLSTIPAQLLTYLASPLLRAHPSMVTWTIWVNLLMAGANLLLNLVLTPSLGGIGAAIALSLSIWCGAIALNMLAEQVAGVPDRPVRSGQHAFFVAAAATLITEFGTALMPMWQTVLLSGPTSMLLLLACRTAGLLRPLATLRHHLSFLPQGLGLLLTRFLLWCDTDNKNDAGGGTV